MYNPDMNAIYLGLPVKHHQIHESNNTTDAFLNSKLKPNLC